MGSYANTNATEQPVHVVRTAGGVAPGGSDGGESRRWSSNLDEDYPDKDRIVLVWTRITPVHCMKPCRGIAERLENYTPKHGSWLDTEIEIGGSPMPVPSHSGSLRREAAAWQDRRNQEAIKVDWRFNHRTLA